MSSCKINFIFTLFLGFAAVAVLLAGCETVKGVGKDIENASTAVQGGFRK